MENYRVRRAIIYYYLEDDTMHITEPRIDNSGACRAAIQSSGVNSVLQKFAQQSPDVLPMVTECTAGKRSSTS